MCLNFRVFPIEAAEACLSLHNHQEKRSVLSLLTKLPSHFSGFPRRYVESETCIKQPLYQPANCLSYQPNEFYVENNVCY